MTGLLDDAVTLYSTEDWRVLRRISVTEPSAPRIVYRSLFNPDQHPAQPPPDTAMSVAFSHDGKFLAIGRISGTVLIIDLSAASAAPTMIEVYKVGNSSSVCALGFSPDGRFLGTGSGLRSDGLTRETESAEKAQENAPIKIWNMADHTLFASYPDRKVAAITQLSWSADSLFLAAGGDRTVRIFAPTNPTHEASVIKFDAPVLSVSFAPAGRSLAIAAGSAITIFSVRP
jgi:WD40 repeat protein